MLVQAAARNARGKAWLGSTGIALAKSLLLTHAAGASGRPRLARVLQMRPKSSTAARRLNRLAVSARSSCSCLRSARLRYPSASSCRPSAPSASPTRQKPNAARGVLGQALAMEGERLLPAAQAAQGGRLVVARDCRPAPHRWRCPETRRSARGAARRLRRSALQRARQVGRLGLRIGQVPVGDRHGVPHARAAAARTRARPRTARRSARWYSSA